MSKYKIKKLVIKAVTKAAFEYLMKGNNFGSTSLCQICKEINSEDDQIHGILKCDKIKQLIQTPLNVVYEDIFGENCDKIDQFLSIADLALRARKELLEN